MAVDLIFAPEAEQEIAEAYAWYEGRRPGLGEEFMRRLDACHQMICRVGGNPRLVPIGPSSHFNFS